MATEIERKFLPAQVPDPELLGEGVPIRQGYLAEDGDTAVRIRITDRAATLTIKAGRGLARTEVELPVEPGDAEELWTHTEHRRLVKTRHRVPLGADGLVAEVDLYGGALDGLCTVEVEFPSIDDAAAFKPPAWFGIDLTDQPGWTNASLARAGRPDVVDPNSP